MIENCLDAGLRVIPLSVTLKLIQIGFSSLTVVFRDVEISDTVAAMGESKKIRNFLNRFFRRYLFTFEMR